MKSFYAHHFIFILMLTGFVLFKAGGALGSDWADHVDALKGYAHLNVSNNSNANSDVRSVKEAASR